MTRQFIAILGLSLPADKIDIAKTIASSSVPVYFVPWFKSTSRTNDGGAVPFAIARLTGSHQVKKAW